MEILFARLQTGVVTAVIAVGLLAAALPARAQEKGAAPTYRELRPLSLEQLQNAQYRLPLLGDEETSIRLLLHGTAGRHRVRIRTA